MASELGRLHGVMIQWPRFKNGSDTPDHHRNSITTANTSPSIFSNSSPRRFICFYIAKRLYQLIPKSPHLHKPTPTQTSPRTTKSHKRLISLSKTKNHKNGQHLTRRSSRHHNRLRIRGIFLRDDSPLLLLLARQSETPRTENNSLAHQLRRRASNFVEDCAGGRRSE